MILLNQSVLIYNEHNKGETLMKIKEHIFIILLLAVPTYIGLILLNHLTLLKFIIVYGLLILIYWLIANKGKSHEPH